MTTVDASSFLAQTLSFHGVTGSRESWGGPFEVSLQVSQIEEGGIEVAVAAQPFDWGRLSMELEGCDLSGGVLAGELLAGHREEYSKCE